MAGIGSRLRGGRIQRGLTIDQVAQETRISARFLEALEEENFAALPAPVYVRGFLRSYANYLRIDANPLLEDLASVQGSSVEGFVPGVARTRPQVGNREGPAADPFRRRDQPGAPPLAPPLPPSAPPRLRVP